MAISIDFNNQWRDYVQILLPWGVETGGGKSPLEFVRHDDYRESESGEEATS